MLNNFDGALKIILIVNAIIIKKTIAWQKY